MAAATGNVVRFGNIGCNESQFKDEAPLARPRSHDDHVLNGAIVHHLKPGRYRFSAANISSAIRLISAGLQMAAVSGSRSSACTAASMLRATAARAPRSIALMFEAHTAAICGGRAP